MITTDRISEVTGRKSYIAGLLEMACQELELPDTQRQAAERAYNAVGNWLGDCPVLGRFQPIIFPQGSIALGTTVRPVGRDEYDVDLVCHLTAGNDNLQQESVKQAVGNRLADNEVYRDMLAEIKRCWRLNYAKKSKLHLDITPAVNNSKCLNGGLCVTDSQAGKWCPSNPKGYVDWFDGKSRQQPKFPRALLESREILAKQANVHPFPDQVPLKVLLRRCVQLLKRHRSILFQKNPEKAPISVILTTLAAKSFEAAALSGTTYETEFDLLLSVIEQMPSFIERRWNGVEQEWWIPNETTLGENFAEKWNRDAELTDAFGRWHQTALSDFKGLAATLDQTNTYSVLEKFAGSRATTAVRNRVTSNVDQMRVNDLLRTGTAGVLTTGAGIAVPRNTFYGK
jgi:SMODS domain-containing protein